MTAKSFTTENSIVMLVDHQTGTKMAIAYDMPLILTTTVEQQVGPTIKDLQEIAPQAYAKRYARSGQLDAWDDPKLQAGVAALGRKKIILAGLTTDICMHRTATSALKLGYEVLVVAPAPRATR